MLRSATVRRASRAIVLATLACLSTGSSASAGDAVRTMVERLRSGGYVLFVRHFATDPTSEDADPVRLENLAGQRRLSDEGRKQAVAAGNVLRKLAVPIERVICSQFDRARESARLLGVGEPEETADVSAPSSAVNGEEERRRANALRSLLSAPPPAGKNTLIVSHNSNLRDSAGVEFADVHEGEVVIFQPTAGSFHAVGRVYPSWEESAWSVPAP